ncbi:MAG: hypothetical protein HDQ88_00880 [Clostridia bacterium]|nr:hypothetical protein [Clostridia bacterium]
MLTLKEVKEAYEGLSGKASDIVRQLTFAGIGIVWIFNRGADVVSSAETCCSNDVGLVAQCQDVAFNIPSGLMTALLLLCLAVAIDLFQYFISTGIWYIIYLTKHNKNVEDDNPDAEKVKDPEWINLFPWILWVGKIVLTIWAYVLIAKFLFQNS